MTFNLYFLFKYKDVVGIKFSEVLEFMKALFVYLQVQTS